MNSFFDLQVQALRLMAKHGETSLAAWTTIALRLPNLAAESFSGRPPSLETRRMVRENVAAAEGALEGAFAGVRLGARAATGQLDAKAFASGWLTVAEAMAEPAERKVRANARRLSRRR